MNKWASFYFFFERTREVLDMVEDMLPRYLGFNFTQQHA